MEQKRNLENLVSVVHLRFKYVLVRKWWPAEFLRPSSGVQNKALSKQSSERYAGRSAAWRDGLWEVIVGMSRDKPGCHPQEVGVTSWGEWRRRRRGVFRRRERSFLSTTCMFYRPVLRTSDKTDATTGETGAGPSQTYTASTQRCSSDAMKTSATCDVQQICILDRRW